MSTLSFSENFGKALSQYEKLFVTEYVKSQPQYDEKLPDVFKLALYDTLNKITQKFSPEDYIEYNELSDASLMMSLEEKLENHNIDEKLENHKNL